MQPLMGRAMERGADGDYRWVYTLFPTHAYASEAEMSLADYEDFYFGACLADRGRPGRRLEAASEEATGWRTGSRATRRSASRAPGTDITLGIAGRTFIPCRRRAQHARRRVLHRADRGLRRGRGDLPPAAR